MLCWKKTYIMKKFLLLALLFIGFTADAQDTSFVAKFVSYTKAPHGVKLYFANDRNDSIFVFDKRNRYTPGKAYRIVRTKSPQPRSIDGHEATKVQVFSI